jgi:hypothetical protein
VLCVVALAAGVRVVVLLGFVLEVAALCTAPFFVALLGVVVAVR